MDFGRRGLVKVGGIELTFEEGRAALVTLEIVSGWPENWQRLLLTSVARLIF